MPKVLISDSMDEIAVKVLKSNNIDVEVITNFTPEELQKNIEKYDGLIVRSATKVTKDIISENMKEKVEILYNAGPPRCSTTPWVRFTRAT